VRAWLESKTPLELNQKLKSYFILKWISTFLITLTIISLILFILDSTQIILINDNTNVFRILAGALILNMSFYNVIIFLS